MPNHVTMPSNRIVIFWEIKIIPLHRSAGITFLFLATRGSKFCEEETQFWVNELVRSLTQTHTNSDLQNFSWLGPLGKMRLMNWGSNFAMIPFLEYSFIKNGVSRHYDLIFSDYNKYLLLQRSTFYTFLIYTF